VAAPGALPECAPAPAALVDSVAVLPMDETAGGPEYMALRAMGVPTVLATSLEEALRYKVVIFAGTMSSALLGEERDAREGAEEVKAYLARGGVALGEAVTAFVARDVFGIAGFVESKDRAEITFEGDDPTLAEVNEEREQTVALTDQVRSTPIGTVGYTPAAGNEVLARFDDGSAAVMKKEYPGGGVAIATGFRFLDAITRFQEGARSSSRIKGLVNTFETDGDVWQLWLRGVYRTYVDGGVTVSTAPKGAPYAVVPTLSQNYSRGGKYTPTYVGGAKANGATTTVFTDTSYVDDFLDSAWFGTGPFESAADALVRNDGEIASHSVSHTPAFKRIPRGTGAERYPGYAPFVASRATTVGSTMMGELRVSRQLLQGYQANVRSFRAPYLAVPRALAPSQDAAGYLYDSSSTQGFVSGAFPFQLPRLDGEGYTNVTTFPIAVENGLTGEPQMTVDEALDLIARNGANGAPSVLLYYPRDTDALPWLVDSWKGVIRGVRASGAWVGKLEEFGRFWRDRQEISLLTSAGASCAGGRTVELRNPTGRTVSGLALDVPEGSGLATMSFGGTQFVRNPAGKILVPSLRAGATLTGEICPSPPST